MTSYGRPTTAARKGTNKDIANFLDQTKGRTYNRQDSGLTRDSGDMSGRTGFGFTKGKAPGGAAMDHLGELSKPTQDQSYGARKRNPMTAADKNDKIIEFERENNTLKEKENFLRQEITMMTTKLRRIETLIKSRSRVVDDLGMGDYDVTDMQTDLRNEVEDLKMQNADIKEKVRKLNVVQRGLTQQMTTGPLHKSGLGKNEKYAHVQGKLDVSHNKVTQRYQAEAKDLRTQININNRKVLELEQELQEAKATHGIGHGGGIEALRQEILDMQRQARECESQMEHLKGDFDRNKNIFEESKTYVSELHDNLRSINEQNETLRQENFRLSLRTQELTELEKELTNTIEERDQIERSIRNVTAEPFLRNKDDGNTVAYRIQELQQRLADKERFARKLKDEENQIVSTLTEQKHEMESLGRDKRDLEKKHGNIKTEFNDKFDRERGPSEQDAFNGLLKMDPSKYATTMVDLAMGVPQDGAPSWANLPFMEPTVTKPDGDPKIEIKAEIERLKQEKSDFASELEKAQNLLKLQTDIEKENTVYYMHEEKRLQLIERSVTAKVEELSRRTDDKARTVNDLERKMTLDMRQSVGADGAPMRASIQTDVDARSEFSAQTQESEIAMDENILDFKIEDADFDKSALSTISSIQMTPEEIEKQFITVVTVDFYNHSTETTQMSEGLRANYQTQFSFVNKVDSFYVSFLQKNSLKLDIYVSKNNAAVQVGRAEILLKELIESEVVSQNVNMKTPIIQRWAKVYPITVQSTSVSNASFNEQMRPLGVIKFKMRLRKPIQQAMRYYREQNEVKNIEKFVSMDPKLGSVKPAKKLITISVVAAHGLKTAYSQTVDMSPFFFYQFYTFDDRYSANSAGTNPKFNDTFSYEVLVDAKAIQFFERETLDVILFDDNAPIAGVGLDENQNQHNDDMLGMAKIPLTSLVTGCSVHSKYPIKNVETGNEVGQLEVMIDIMELERAQNDGLFFKATQDLVYSKKFEQEIIMHIARKLAPLNVDIELMFGIFSQGQRNCTKTDFKHTCLNRLRLLRDGVQERELDIFLQSNDYIRDSEVIEKQDFVQIFSGPVASARNERLNQISIDQTLARETMGRDRTVNMASLQENEIYEILTTAITMGAQYKILQEAQKRSTLNRIRSFQLKGLFTVEGIHEQDASKVIKYLENDEQVDLGRLDEAFARAKAKAIRSSSALGNLKRLIQTNGKLIVENMERQDYNKDGILNIDGFEASLLIREVGMSNSDLKECFYLVCNHDMTLAYQSWLLAMFPVFKPYFTLTVTPRDTTKIEESVSHSLIDQSSAHMIETSMNDRTHGQSVAQAAGNSQHKYLAARQKIENYIVSQDLNLGMMFAIIDTNSNSEISFAEFRQKMNAMHIPLEDDECHAFFRHLDINGSNSVDFVEFVNEFASLSTEKVIKNIKKILTQGGIDPDYFFNKHAKMDRTHNKMMVSEFTNLLKEVQPNLIKREIYHVIKQFDRGNTGQVTKSDFLHVISSEFVEQKTFNLSIEDIVKPLATKLQKFNINLAEQFVKYDKSRDGKLSAEELREALLRNQIKLSDDDVQVIKDYFRNKTRSEEIPKNEFIDLMSKTFDRKFDNQAARKSLSDIKMKAEELKLDQAKLQEQIQSFNEEKRELINIANFKKAINSLKCLDQYSIDNLSKFMDSNNEGYISVANFLAQVSNAVMSSSFRSTLTNKWAR